MTEICKKLKLIGKEIIKYRNGRKMSTHQFCLFYKFDENTI